MADNSRMTPWWISIVAAIVAFVFLSQNVGEGVAAALCGVSLALFGAYRIYRAAHPPAAATPVCLTCGEPMSATARHCKHCGGASWTVRQ